MELDDEANAPDMSGQARSSTKIDTAPVRKVVVFNWRNKGIVGNSVRLIGCGACSVVNNIERMQTELPDRWARYELRF